MPVAPKQSVLEHALRRYFGSTSESHGVRAFFVGTLVVLPHSVWAFNLQAASPFITERPSSPGHGNDCGTTRVYVS